MPLLGLNVPPLPLSQVQFTHSLSQLGEAIVSFLPKGEEGEARGAVPDPWSLGCTVERQAAMRLPREGPP